MHAAVAKEPVIPYHTISMDNAASSVRLTMAVEHFLYASLLLERIDVYHLLSA